MLKSSKCDRKNSEKCSKNLKIDQLNKKSKKFIQINKIFFTTFRQNYNFDSKNTNTNFVEFFFLSFAAANFSDIFFEIIYVEIIFFFEINEQKINLIMSHVSFNKIFEKNEMFN